MDLQKTSKSLCIGIFSLQKTWTKFEVLLRTQLLTNGLIASDSGAVPTLMKTSASRSKSWYQLKAMNTSLSGKLKKEETFTYYKNCMTF